MSKIKITCTKEQKDNFIENGCPKHFEDGGGTYCNYGIDEEQCQECVEKHIDFEIVEDRQNEQP